MFKNLFLYILDHPQYYSEVWHFRYLFRYLNQSENQDIIHHLNSADDKLHTDLLVLQMKELVILENLTLQLSHSKGQKQRKMPQPLMPQGVEHSIRIWVHKLFLKYASTSDAARR